MSSPPEKNSGRRWSAARGGRVKDKESNFLRVLDNLSGNRLYFFRGRRHGHGDD
jgi:hypothetical protein